MNSFTSPSSERERESNVADADDRQWANVGPMLTNTRWLLHVGPMVLPDGSYQMVLPDGSIRRFYQWFYQTVLPDGSTRRFYQMVLPDGSTRRFYQTVLAIVKEIKDGVNEMLDIPLSDTDNGQGINSAILRRTRT